MFEAMATAMFLSGRTSTIGIGHLVLCDAMRHPAMLAKDVTSLDHASGGRFELGIGWGSVPEELSTFGVGSTDPGARVRRLAETLDVVRALWTGEVVNYAGEFHNIDGGQQLPIPLDTIPIVIGGVGPKTLRLVAQHADWWNISLNNLHRLDDLRASVGSARVSVQQMVAFVPDESSRADVTAVAEQRFGAYGEGLKVGTASELIEYFGHLESKGVERAYVWFADFAKPTTLHQFGEEVVAQLT
jgi:alkanesulfonate monooxygenase SsuD/methylene tetrahydromethanopterin reductase-like flavin-dependent oxidoreductase (luciferase family)